MPAFLSSQFVFVVYECFCSYLLIYLKLVHIFIDRINKLSGNFTGDAFQPSKPAVIIGKQKTLILNNCDSIEFRVYLVYSAIKRLTR
ncbi:hypothetical protein GWI33_020853 [Rhynchophorus ferrugineus]|uniref:Uncharacterized protein n=1 Tax=Rhynchophorus ferrugineus TaxID=354439 RepID=A0A834HR97_RHYFE|nr:hypothetical protein GWI33_020853 [Rhynchophorus ferrugineus]